MFQIPGDFKTMKDATTRLHEGIGVPFETEDPHTDVVILLESPEAQVHKVTQKDRPRSVRISIQFVSIFTLAHSPRYYLST